MTLVGPGHGNSHREIQAFSSATNLKSYRNWFEKRPAWVTKPRTIVRLFYLVAGGVIHFSNC